MAMDDVREFFQYVDTDVALQGMLNVVAWDPRDTAEIAVLRGFSVTEDDLQTVMTDVWGDLSEDALANVCGGGSKSVPPGQGINDHGDGSWSPPPGDVSGRSCFFGRKG